MVSALGLLGIAACVSAPVQEMSDARQAIYAAEVSGATERAAADLQSAVQRLQQAQGHLETGAYDAARRAAVEAREQAIRAREQARRSPTMPPSSLPDDRPLKGPP